MKKILKGIGLVLFYIICISFIGWMYYKEGLM